MTNLIAQEGAFYRYNGRIISTYINVRCSNTFWLALAMTCTKQMCCTIDFIRWQRRVEQASTCTPFGQEGAGYTYGYVGTTRSFCSHIRHIPWCRGRVSEAIVIMLTKGDVIRAALVIAERCNRLCGDASLHQLAPKFVQAGPRRICVVERCSTPQPLSQHC